MRALRFAIVLAALVFSARLAAAQGTAPPTNPAAPAPTDDASATRSKLGSLYQDFRQFKNRLPFDLSAGVYLYYYQPLSETVLTPGDLTGSFQVYAFYLKLDKEWHGLGGHVEMRMRDGGHVGAGSMNAYLRGFYSSNFWFQEIYAYYHPRRWLNLKAGKIYRQVGIFWDDSFFGNIQYFDGLKLNPDYGLSLEGDKGFAGDRVVLGWSAQYFMNSDGINGGLSYQRQVASPINSSGALDPYTLDPNPEGELIGSGTPASALKHVVDGRLTLTVRPARRLSVALGASGLTGLVHRINAYSLLPDEERFSQVAGDLTISVGPVTAYGEFLRQFGPGARDADYALAGARLRVWRLSIRFNTSYVRYLLDRDVEEFILQPGVTFTIGGGLSALVEYDEWQRKDPRGLPVPGAPFPVMGTLPTSKDFISYDRSLNFVLAYSY